MANPQPKLSPYVKSGAATIGALTGAALQAVTGDSVAASTAGAAFGALLDDIGTRLLSARESARIQLASSFAASAIKDRYEAGHDYRADDFFEADPYTRSSFEEVAEGVLLAAQKEHEELKVPFMGYLLANIAFEETIDRTTANWAIRTSSDLSWTQLMLLALIESDAHALPHVRIGDFSRSWDNWSAHKELMDLHTARGLIGAPGGKTERLGLSYINNNLADMSLSSGGRLLFGLMQLENIDRQPLDELYGRLVVIDEGADTPPPVNPSD
ncbi:hypothetical protein [Micromonospora sp. CPCC 205561]|uniref:hypothetical protein n=1 Tax=Micromonospora sp. CPCC 205561 TaxID=3122407 RepID=UPI002FEFEB8D